MEICQIFLMSSKTEKRKRIRQDKELSTLGPIVRVSRQFIFGNFDPYYRYRNSFTADFDVRLASLCSFFGNIWHDKTVIDVGCGAGFVTLLLAKIFGAKSVLGLDVDQKLIFKALKNLRTIKTNGVTLQAQDSAKFGETVPMSFTRRRGIFPYALKPWVIPCEIQISPSRFPYNVEFRLGSILDFGSETFYERVFCLSVALWIHLNYGDDGVKALFRKLKEILAPQGLLFLEIEPWKNYKKHKNLTGKIRENFENIKFRPATFSNFLIETLEMKFVQRVHPAKIHFDRPILVFQK